MYKNVLVTGSSGFIGSFLVKFLKLNFYNVYNLDIDDLDILDKEEVFNFLKTKKIDCIIHLAALSNAKKSFSDPEKYMDSGIICTLNLLQACEKFKIPKFIYMSSLTVHGKNDEEVNEDSPTNPKHFYAASKVAGESIVNVFSQNSDIKTYILRPNLIMGYDLNYPDLINIFIKEINQNNTYTVLGDGKHLRDWVHVQDIVQAIKLSIDDEDLDNETFCIGTNRYSTLQLAELISSKLGKGNPIFNNDDSQAFSLFCNSSKIRERLNWQPEFSLERIINERIKILNENQINSN